MSLKVLGYRKDSDFESGQKGMREWDRKMKLVPFLLFFSDTPVVCREEMEEKNLGSILSILLLLTTLNHKS